MKIEPLTHYTAIGSRQAMAQNLFRCGRCHNPSQQAGRRRRLVCGVHTWVCAACVGREAKA